MKRNVLSAVVAVAFGVTTIVRPSILEAQCASCNGIGGSCIHGPLQGENYEDCDDNPDLGICVEIGKKDCGGEPMLTGDYATGSSIAVYARVDVLADGTRVFRTCSGEIVAFGYSESGEAKALSSTDTIEI